MSSDTKQENICKRTVLSLCAHSLLYKVNEKQQRPADFCINKNNTDSNEIQLRNPAKEKDACDVGAITIRFHRGRAHAIRILQKVDR